MSTIWLIHVLVWVIDWWWFETSPKEQIFGARKIVGHDLSNCPTFSLNNCRNNKLILNSVDLVHSYEIIEFQLVYGACTERIFDKISLKLINDDIENP